MTVRFLMCAAIIGVWLTDAGAHHSWVLYDTDNVITVKGAVTKVEWTSPHAFVMFDAVESDGRTVSWTMELDPPVLLRRYGLTSTTIKPGEEITVTGVRAKSGAAMMRGTFIVLADGTRIRTSSRV